ncbi:MAG: NifB/NifX family molybdenum-iron cluster-binding protein [Actinobacteria bacterium]|nr:NifB/NifX family molybdenum-iron cluster-binding protein [Actinomycetota bacterium]
MKIAISTDNNHVSSHFGRCPEFTIVEIEDGKVINTEVLKNPGHHPGYLPQFLRTQGVSHIVAGGMGMRARELFAEAGINAVLGVEGSIDDVLKRILEGSLKGGENICNPGDGRGYGLDKTVCEHGKND